MMWKITRRFFYILFFLCTLAGCATQRNIVTPLEVDFPSNYTQKYIFEAVKIGAYKRNWNIVEENQDSIIASFTFKTSTISVLIKADKNKCTINYYNSENCHYRKSLWSSSDSVSKSTNAYLLRLQEAIRNAIKDVHVIELDDKDKAKLNSYIGKPYSILFSLYGKPESSYDDGLGGKIYDFAIQTVKASGYTMNRFGTGETINYQPNTITQYIIFFVNKDGNIYNWQEKIKKN